MHTDIPTCAIADRIDVARATLESTDWDICAVVNDERILLGILYGGAWDAPGDTVVEEVMSNGPPTTRPSTFIDEEVERLQKRRVPGIFVTSSDGALMGYLRTSNAAAAMESGNCARTWADRNCSPSEAE